MTATKKDPFKEVIKAYLDNLAATDELFAKSYAKENKNIDECVKFIYQEVKKSGRCGFNDNEIFNMAVHYYDEDDLGKISNVNGMAVVNHAIQLTEEEKAAAKARAIADFEAAEKRRLESQAKSASTPKPASKQKSKKETKTAAPSLQSLFDFDMNEDETED